jgi:hypothetical protein
VTYLHGHPDGSDVLGCRGRVVVVRFLVSQSTDGLRSTCKKRRDDRPALPTSGSRMRPTKALGMFHSWHVSSIELTRMSVRRRIARISICDTKERWGASRRTGAEAREDGDGGEGDARRPGTHL